MDNILGKVKCIKNAYTDEFAEGEPKIIVLQFIKDKVYDILDNWHLQGYLLINESGEEHTVGNVGDDWFDNHFKLLS